MLYRSMVAALGAIGSASAAAVPNEKRCSGLGCVVEEIVYDVVKVLEPVVISTYCPKNTVLKTKGFTFSVNNAPTHFKTTVTETTSATVTKTVSTGSKSTVIKTSTLASTSTAAPTTISSIASSASSAAVVASSVASSSSAAAVSSSSSTYVSVPTSAAGEGLNTALYTATSSYPQSSSTAVTTYTTTQASTTELVSSTTVVPAAQTSQAAGQYTDWTTFIANGANLGNWMEIEYSNNQYFWDSYVNSTEVTDEWTFCETLGSECGSVMEAHYANAVTTETIDKLASVGVNFLRIPTTYAAWIDYPGSQLYHGAQQTYLRTICEYAIGTYGMRVVLGLHSLPGGANGLDIGEASGHDAWFFNETNLQYTYNAVSEILTFIEASSYPWAYTIGLLNEASDNPSAFASQEGLTTNGTDWIVKYVNGSLDLVAGVNTKIPLMLQDCFLGEEYWSGYWPSGTNLVIDTHIYYFSASGIYSEYVYGAICGQASVAGGDGKFPVFVGEWSLQVLYNNTYSGRQNIFNTQRYAWGHYVQGGAFWGAIFNGTATVDGEGVQRDYWGYDLLIDDGVIQPINSTATYC